MEGWGVRGGCIRDYTSKSACPLKVCCVYLCAAEFPQSVSVTCLAVGPKPAVPHISLHKVGQKEVCLSEQG